MDWREGTGNHLPPLPDYGRVDGARGDFDSLFMILPSSLHPRGCNCEHCHARRSINNFNQSAENMPQQPSFPRQNDIDVKVASSSSVNSGQGLELATQSESINSGLPNRARPQCHNIELVKKFTLQLLRFTAGQDIFAKIKGFAQTKKMCMVVLSASGALSKLLHREGEFKILTISGTFIPGEEGAADMKRANLAVSACSVDGRVVGGSVEGEGELIAGDTLEVTLGGFS